MKTPRKPEVVSFCEDYNGHTIQNATKPVDMHNKDSGHSWTEYVELTTFSVREQTQSLSPTRCAIPWRTRQFKTVKAAQLEIDGAVSLAFEIARISHRNGVAPDGTNFENIWRAKVLAELASTARNSITAVVDAPNHTRPSV